MINECFFLVNLTYSGGVDCFFVYILEQRRTDGSTLSWRATKTTDFIKYLEFIVLPPHKVTPGKKKPSQVYTDWELFSLSFF